MKMIKLFLIFFIYQASLSQKCNRKILENYGIISLLQPAKEKLVFCPNIKASCCPSYEQFKMFNLYQKEIKPHFIQLGDLIERELKLLKSNIEPLLKEEGELQNRVAKIESVSLKRQAEDLMSRLKSQNFGVLVSKAFKYKDHAFAYTSSLKSTFFCSICDFAGQNFINLNQGTITFSDDSCDELVNSTLMYSNIINRGIVIFLQNLSSLLNKIDQKNKVITIPGIEEVNSSIKECTQEFKETEEDLSSCRKYCSYYKLNSDLPVFEGYPEFFLNILVQIKMNFSPPKTNRILEALQNIDKDEEEIIHQKNKLSYQRKKKRYQKMLNILTNFDNQRILSEETPFNDDLNPQVFMDNKLESDIFDEQLSNKEFDEHMMSEMLEIQNILQVGEPQDLKKIIKRHYVQSFEPEIEDIASDDIFRTASEENVYLEKLNSKFAFDGIRFSQIIREMDWNLQFNDIVLSLSGKEHSTGNEVIDKKLLKFLNKVLNHNINDFHSDNFLDFQDNNEFAQKEYLKSRKESDELKILKQKEKFKKAHELFKEYNLTNADDIIKQLESQQIQLEKDQNSTENKNLQSQVEQVKEQLHQLIKQEEEKNSQEKDFSENKEFLAKLIKEKGLKGVIEDLKKSNQQTTQTKDQNAQVQVQETQKPEQQQAQTAPEQTDKAAVTEQKTQDEAQTTQKLKKAI